MWFLFVGWSGDLGISLQLYYSRSGLPGSVFAVCRSEGLSSVRGMADCFFSRLSYPCLFLKPIVY